MTAVGLIGGHLARAVGSVIGMQADRVADLDRGDLVVPTEGGQVKPGTPLENSALPVEVAAVVDNNLIELRDSAAITRLSYS
jgi:hypothetical protein